MIEDEILSNLTHGVSPDQTLPKGSRLQPAVVALCVATSVRFVGRFKRGVSSSSLFLGIPPRATTRADYVTHLARRGTFGSFKITTNFFVFFLLPYSSPSFKYLFEILRGWSIYRKHSLLGVGSIFPTSGGLAPPLSSSVLEDSWIGFRGGHFWISELTHKKRTELLREERRHRTLTGLVESDCVYEGRRLNSCTFPSKRRSQSGGCSTCFQFHHQFTI